MHATAEQTRGPDTSLAVTHAVDEAPVATVAPQGDAATREEVVTLMTYPQGSREFNQFMSR